MGRPGPDRASLPVRVTVTVVGKPRITVISGSGPAGGPDPEIVTSESQSWHRPPTQTSTQPTRHRTLVEAGPRPGGRAPSADPFAVATEPGPARSLRSLRPVRRGGRHSKRCQTVDAGQATPAALAAARTGPAASRADRPEGQASPAAGPKAVKLT